MVHAVNLSPSCRGIVSYRSPHLARRLTVPMLQGVETACRGIPSVRRLICCRGNEVTCNGIPSARRLILFSNVAGALKLVAEAFPWQEGSQFVYTQDNHNSVLGIRELAIDQGASATCVEMSSAKGDLLYSYVSMGMCLLQAVPHLSDVMLCLTGQMLVACCATLCHIMLCMLCLSEEMFVHAVLHHIVSCCATPCHVMLCMLYLIGQMFVACCAAPCCVMLCMLWLLICVSIR